MCLSEMEVAAPAGATRGQCEHIAGQPCYILRPRPDSPQCKPAHPREGTAPTCWPVVGLQFRFQFSRSVLSDSSRPHGLQHARPPCPSPTPEFVLKLMSIESGMPSNHLILCRPLLLWPSVFPDCRLFRFSFCLLLYFPYFLSLINNLHNQINFRLGQ